MMPSGPVATLEDVVAVDAAARAMARAQVTRRAA